MSIPFLRAVTAFAAVAAMPVIGWAQSSVTLFGTVDVGIAHVAGDNSSRTGLAHSGANISRIGFRGTEDLGGGLSAGFWLESGFAPDTGLGTATGGALAFNRRSTVSVMGPFGEVRLGRDDSATFLNTLIFDPFLTNGVGGTNAFVMNGAPIQIGNAISYFLPPDLGGFYGQLQHAAGEQANTAPTSAGEYNGGRFGWRRGAFHVSGALAKLQGTTQLQDVRIRNGGASYDFGVAVPMLLWASEKRGTVEIRATQLGVKVPVGAGEIRAQVSRYDTVGSNADWTKVALGYGHNLSRRTQVYGAIARIHNGAGAQRAIGAQGVAASGTNLGGKSTGFDLGIRHFF